MSEEEKRRMGYRIRDIRTQRGFTIRELAQIAGVSEDVAREALRLASHKLPLKTKFLKREEKKEVGGEA